MARRMLFVLLVIALGFATAVAMAWACARWSSIDGYGGPPRDGCWGERARDASRGEGGGILLISAWLEFGVTPIETSARQREGEKFKVESSQFKWSWGGRGP